MKKVLNVKDLIVNPENYRFDSVDTEDEAIEVMLQDKGKEIVNIATHIVDKGLDQARDIRVIKKEGQYVVLDGNRRITAIKCVLNPGIVKDAKFRVKFEALNAKAKVSTLENVNCYIYPTEEASSEWVRLDHTGKNEGVGQDSWGSPEVERFDQKFGGKLSLAMQAVDILKKNGIKIDTKRAKITTVNRLFSDPFVREYMGISKNNGDLEIITAKKEAIARMSKVFKEVIDNNLKVKSVYEKADRERFVKSLFSDKPKSTKDKQGKVTPLTQQAVQRSIPVDRKTLIPKTCVLKIKQTKLNNIYHELKAIPVDDYVNAVAVLLRVFLESSSDYYLEKKTINVKKTSQHDPSLSEKLTAVANDLKLSKDEMKVVNKATTSKNTIYSIDTFNAYVHNNKLHPSPKELKITWDEFQPFFQRLWDSI